MPLTHGRAEARALFILLRAPGLGQARLRQLLPLHGSACALLDGGPGAWRAAGLSAPTIAYLQSPPPVDADLTWLEADHHHLLACVDADYPALLARTPHAPAALLVVGAVDVLWRAQIGIVGSRNPTAGGVDNAREFARTLARAGLAVTSGLAEGVDAAAHRAALDAGVPTLAVMGTGPDRIYPARHRGLARDIVAAGGALVSEWSPGIGARREHFPRRNRIIAGLSLGVLVVEAAVQSGALITARLAAEAGREVFALPGSIHNPLARGCHRLIRDGAALVETAQEILDALAPAARELGADLRARLDAASGEPAAAAGSADPERQRLRAALGHDPVDLDALAERTGLTVGVLSSMLLVMELEGEVVADHGRYARRT